jgi:hypothetical protein
MDNDTQIKKHNVNTVVNKNKIKQSVLCCTYCGKSYKTKMSLDKHFTLCEITHKLKSQTNNEDNIIIPSQRQMYQIIMELALKCNTLENKVSYLNKFMSKKINKVNIVDYLNNNINKPALLFDNIAETINIEQSDIEYLFHNSFKETFNNIISRMNYNKNNIEITETLPIIAFVEKKNIIYIYNTNLSWIVAPREKIIRLLNTIQLKMSKALSEWRKKNIQMLNENDAKSILYDKTFSKLIGVDFKIDEIYNKFYNNIYHKIKKELNVGFVE